MKIHPEAYSIQADQYIQQEQTNEERIAFQHAIAEDPLFNSFLAERVLLTEGIRHHVLQEKAEEWFFKYQPGAKKTWQKKQKKSRAVSLKIVAGILLLIGLALYFQFNTESAVPMPKIVSDDSTVKRKYGGDKNIEWKTMELSRIEAEVKGGKLVKQAQGKSILINISQVEEERMVAELLDDKLALILPKRIGTTDIKLVQLQIEKERFFFLYVAKEWYPLTLGEEHPLDSPVSDYYQQYLKGNFRQ